ncbi:MAG: dihydroorotase [Alphaproteobacteria bacterium]|nr:dihydroorotase [Alphaproteobacteria bacterium]
MSESYDLILKNGTVATPWGIASCDVAVTAGRIAAIGWLGSASAADVRDLRGLHVLPGVIDSQVHFREPGPTHKEDLETGSRAAVLGGVTSVFEMPNTSPPTTTAEALDDKFSRARGRMWCDHAFYVGATPENAEALPALERLPGVAGVKMFMGSSTGNLLVADDAHVGRVLAHGCRRVSVHAEDEARLKARKNLAALGDPRTHPVWRDAEAALLATQRVVALARKYGRRVHVLHVSTGDEMVYLRDHKDIASIETTPNHLTLVAPECYERLGTYAQMNPPVRDMAHRDAIWKAIGEGIVDVLGSDHAPHTREEKDKTYPDTPSGMTGVQTLVPIMLDHVSSGRLSLERFVDLTAHGPQRIFGLATKGRIAVGFDADFTIVDLKARRVIENKWIASRCGWTPFDGMTVTGFPVGTLVRGETVMWEDDVKGSPRGEPLKFLETLAPF